MKKDESPDNYWDVERNISYDNNGNLHGNIYMRENDIELRENYQHGQLIKSEKYSISRGIILSPKRGENRFKDMWKFKLPTSYFGNGFRVDSNPLIGLSYFDLTAESEYNEERISREMEKHNKE